MLPVHLATYRERGVLRRLAVAGFPRWSFPVAELALGMVAVITASAILLAVAAPVYGIPTPHHWLRVLAGIVLGTTAFISLGVLLGTVLPTARAAQAIGLLLFFPSFLLGAGGPPPHAMGSILRHIRGFLPLTWMTDAIRKPWLGIGSANGSLLMMAVLAVATTVVAIRRAAL
jgi:ABC-2 type transport system permease protein